MDFTMNRRALKNTVAAAAVLAVVAALWLSMRPTAPGNFGPDQLAEGSVFELPQAAARLVSQAPAADRPAVAREVVRQLAALSPPGVTPFAISAICQAAPEVAPEAVSAAVSLQPGQARSIVQAGVIAAPGQREAIATAWNRRLAGMPMAGTVALPQVGLQPTTSPLRGPPREGLPSTPKSGASTELNAGAGTAVRPDTSRDYSAP
jgi:hypothetical protein